MHRAMKLDVIQKISLIKKQGIYIWPLKFACAYLNTQESSPSGTPLKRLQVFVETAKHCAIFRCFGKVEFPSFSLHFE
ncbi:hypothetical protein T12_539 [Trichinella patagoniensis]|uniref:Uncharacterized protein n=1 Tax=Trichinella patagoniensis TaxID=990121 RepID=A0A0V0ZKU0_9BILA|nr:hypothetical protein T12_539 [Trichinella patagoniensis]